MFISIPEEFFVPVLFSERFTLNLENNNMEYDTEKEDIIKARYRSSGEEIVPSPVTGVKSGKGPVPGQIEDMTKYPTEESEEKEKVEKEINLDKANDEQMLSEADEEYIHSKAVEE